MTMINHSNQSDASEYKPSLSEDVKPTGKFSPDQHESVVEQETERQRKKIMLCSHKDKKHYAKGMCHNCYHRKGKTKKAYACGHPHKAHYSAGMCQNCYLAKYYLKRKLKQQAKLAEKLSQAGDSEAMTKVMDSQSDDMGVKKQKLIEWFPLLWLYLNINWIIHQTQLNQILLNIPI